MHKLLFIILVVAFSCCQQQHDAKSSTSLAGDETLVAATLDSLNATAARADYNAYFDLYADEAVFTGTDATERWTKDEFMQWAKPYFDRGKAWSFSAVDRHIFFDSTGNIAWFDELLNTQMKICRGSGVLTRDNGKWKIKQYILSTTVPNNIIDSIVAMKAEEEDSILQKHLQR